ncbi:MAG: C40 family peptidase [Bacteroidales bacterium]|nr:C40 family peptidase [Bacteroidales bacterium]
MRSDPSDKAEMVNQLLKNDTFELLDIQEKWTLIKCDYDGYTGWVDNKQYRLMDSFYRPAQMGNMSSPSQVATNTYLDAPYLWGGRTVMGIDCSGLTQVCFMQCGIKLLRDASQQVGQGLPIDTLADAQCDDLCFFANPQGRIIHVGIYMGQNRIIHASGQVRIDTLTQQGIINTDNHQLTHHLHSIRRISR